MHGPWIDDAATRPRRRAETWRAGGGGRHGHVAPECGSAGARRLAVLLPSGAAERYAS